MGDALPRVDIDMPGLAEQIERMTQQEINELPFGVIRLDAAGSVVFYSDLEREQSGIRKEVLNRSYFTDIAPCLNNERFRSRIDKAMASGSLDISFDFTADLPSGARDVDLHVRMQSANNGGCWVFVKIED